MTHFPQRLADIASGYDVLLCDIWGVVHNGEAVFPQACETLSAWRRDRGPVILISNSPRPSTDVAEQLEVLQAPQASWSAIVTSGDVTRVLLRDRAPGPALAIGPERDAPLYAGLGLSFTLDPNQATFVSCTGLIDDENEQPDDYGDLLEQAADRGLAMVCANPDRVVQRGDRMIPCAGALADLYETYGGKVVMAGKPHPPIYDLALSEAAALLKAPVDRSRVLVIGDGFATDLAGANAQKLDALFVGGGIHGAAAVTRDGGLDPDATVAALLRAGVTATYAMASLR